MKGFGKYFVLSVVVIFAASAPYIFRGAMAEHMDVSDFPGWPQVYEGKTLTELALTDKEQGFAKGFPGKISRFSDGERELVIRWVNKPTRKLHPASDCFKGLGYYIKPLPIYLNSQGIEMGCFMAARGAIELRVCEYVESERGQSWSDISAWYWGVITEEPGMGWMSYVVAERVGSSNLSTQKK